MELQSYYQKKNNKRIRNNIGMTLASFVLILLAGFAFASTNSQWYFFIFLAIVIPLSIFLLNNREIKKWKEILKKPFPESYERLLKKHVDFYNQLKESEKRYFEQRILYFLKDKAVTGIDCEITDQIRIFVAASAIMPIFSFPNFFYRNINEILVYPDSFDENYRVSGDGERKRIAGMVGNGAMNRMMILSRRDLMKAFDNRIDADNVAIHEFVHLIDMADGKIDGIPQTLIDRQYTIPWVAQIHREMKMIQKRRSDIDSYALTNSGEFLAVASEYFFDSPEKFKEKHPELYKSMARIFKR